MGDPDTVAHAIPEALPTLVLVPVAVACAAEVAGPEACLTRDEGAFATDAPVADPVCLLVRVPDPSFLATAIPVDVLWLNALGVAEANAADVADPVWSLVRVPLALASAAEITDPVC